MSGEIVVIAEKPELARAIAAGLGGGTNRDGFIDCGKHYVTWALGHMLQYRQPEWEKGTTLSMLPVLLDPWPRDGNDRTAKQLGVIQRLLRSASSVIHAGDPDEEGQLIVDEILEESRCRLPCKRLLINDNNIKVVQKALASMKDNSEYKGMSDAADARSLCDLIYGVNVTRAYTIAARSAGHDMLLTVGRVQTPILGLVVRRQREFESHKVAYYWNVNGTFQIGDVSFPARYQVRDGDPVDDKGRINDEAAAKAIAAAVRGKPARIVDTKTTAKEATPPLPYNLLKLQVDAARKFGMKPDQVLDITQSLREKHQLITYNRSDSQYLNDEQHGDAPGVLAAVGKTAPGLAGVAGRADAKIKSKAFNSSKVTAHHAIIPTEATADFSKLSDAEQKIYMLIARSYIAQFWPNHRYDQTDVTVECEGRIFKCRSNVTTHEGWRALYRNDVGNEETEAEEGTIESDLRSLTKGSSGRCATCEAQKQETKPAPLFTMATLLVELTRIARHIKDDRLRKILIEKDKEKAGEHGGIGTPATRDKIIAKLYKFGFLADKGKSIIATPSGHSFYDTLPDQAKFPDMTALWHEQQKEITAGRRSKQKLVGDVIQYVRDEIDRLKTNGLAITSNAPKCPKCERPLRRIKGSKGPFWSCTGRNEGCNFTADDKKGKPDLAGRAVYKTSTEHKCDDCGNGLVRRPSAKKKDVFWWACSGYPGCTRTYFDKDGSPDRSPKPAAGASRAPSGGDARGQQPRSDRK